ncbi:MAG TPA: hypothetical protein VLA13_08105 [Massilibacterium sp.]|nr:hypothetical protein [Massilibacterium sp.]
MNKLIAFILLIFITQLSYGQVECKTDRFTGETTCKTSFVDISTSQSDAYRANIIAAYNRQYFFMILTTISDDWQYLQTNNVYFLVDGNRIKLKLERVDSKIQSAGVIEQQGFILTKEQIHMFAEAKKVEFKIADDVYTMPKEVISDLSELLRKVSN